MVNKWVLYSILLIIFIFIIRNIINSRNNSPILVGNNHDASKLITLSNDNIPFSKKNGGLTYSISFWSYIKNWKNIGYKKKVIINWVDNLQMFYESKINNLKLRIKLINGQYEEYYLKNLTLQKWNNIIIIVNNRYVDIFINGNLEKSIHLKTLPNYSRNILNICPNSGYNGYLSNLRFFNYPLTLFDISYIKFIGPKLPSLFNFLLKAKPSGANSCN